MDVIDGCDNNNNNQRKGKEMHQGMGSKKEWQEEQRQEQKSNAVSKAECQALTLVCKLCTDYLNHAITTQCDHHFCQVCIQEYMLFLDECPECLMKIRTQRISRNHLLDSIVVNYVKMLGGNELGDYMKKHEDYKIYRLSRVIGELNSGDQVDVRNFDYVWSKGRVMRTINKYHDKKIKYYIIKYDNNKKKEEFPETSARLAPLGFYSLREDIPKYEGGRKVIHDCKGGNTYHVQSEEQQQKPTKKIKGEQEQI